MNDKVFIFFMFILIALINMTTFTLLIIELRERSHYHETKPPKPVSHEYYEFGALPQTDQRAGN